MKHEPQALLFLLALLLTECSAGAQSVLDGFKPAQRADYYKVVLQPDGGIVAGGSRYSGEVTHPQLVHVLPNGVIDFTAPLSNFSSNAGVLALCSLPDGSVLAGGGFSSWGGEFCSGFIKLRPGGNWDRGFVPPDTSFDWLSGDIHALPDGRVVYASGSFWNSYVGRLKADGSADPSWSPVGGYAQGRCVLPLPDGRMIIAADSIKRLLPNGTVDASFTTQSASYVRVLALQKDGKILVGGGFHDIGGVVQDNLARLLPDGTLDAAFTPDINGDVWEVEVQRDGRILIAGSFTQVQGQTQYYGARLHPDGSFDAGFRPQSFEWFHDFEERLDGIIVTAGGLQSGDEFNSFRTLLGHIHPDGTVDGNWSFRIDGAVNTAAVQADGLVVCGASSTLRDQRLVRLRKDGELDTSLICDIEGGIHTVAGGIHAVLVLADGDIVLGGDFFRVNDTSRYNLARVSASGMLRPGFESWFNNQVNALRLLPDGRILVAGEFTYYDDEPCPHLTRLLEDGSRDASFNASTDGPVDALSVLPDGRWFAAGRFTQAGGIPREYLARFAADGALDTVFSPTLNGAVRSVFAVEDGGCLICGDFTQVNGQARPGIARLHVDGSLDLSMAPSMNMRARAVHQRPDGAVLVAGDVFLPHEFDPQAGTWEPRLFIMGIDGSVQIELLNEPESDAEGHVSVITALPDGRMLLGGSFYHYLVQPDDSDLYRTNLVRISSPPQSYQRLAFSASGRVLTWARQVAAAHLVEVLFEIADSTGNWLPLGAATRIGTTGDWAMTGLNLPPGQCQVRARGRAAGGEGSWHQFTSWADVPLVTPFGDWQEARFGLRAGDVLAAAWWAVAGESGMENLLDYALGAEPAESVPADMLPKATHPANNIPGFQCHRWPGRADVILTVQVANELSGHWTDVARSVAGGPFTALVSEVTVEEDIVGLLVIATVSEPGLFTAGLPPPRRFYRLGVTQVPP